MLGLLAALGSRSRNLVAKRAAGLYVWVFRGTPVLVQIALLYYGIPSLLGLDPFPKQYGSLPELIGGAFLAATLALGINEGAYMSEIIRAGILSVDPGQAEAAKSLGMTPGKTMSRIVLPQRLRQDDARDRPAARQRVQQHAQDHVARIGRGRHGTAAPRPEPLRRHVQAV